MLVLEFDPQSYPFKPPRIHFATKVFHPCVAQTGRLCMPVLEDAWAPALKVCKLLGLIEEYLDRPSLEHTLQPLVADLFVKNRK